jgi:hypothetical protein
MLATTRMIFHTQQYNLRSALHPTKKSQEKLSRNYLKLLNIYLLFECSFIVYLWMANTR